MVKNSDRFEELTGLAPPGSNGFWTRYCEKQERLAVWQKRESSGNLARAGGTIAGLPKLEKQKIPQGTNKHWCSLPGGGERWPCGLNRLLLVEERHRAQVRQGFTTGTGALAFLGIEPSWSSQPCIELPDLETECLRQTATGEIATVKLTSRPATEADAVLPGKLAQLSASSVLTEKQKALFHSDWAKPYRDVTYEKAEILSRKLKFKLKIPRKTTKMK